MLSRKEKYSDGTLHGAWMQYREWTDNDAHTV